MREVQVRDLVVVLRQPEDGSLRGEVPENDVGVVAFLAGGDQVALVGNSEALDLVIMCC